MIRTLVSIFASFAIILGLSLFELYYVGESFRQLHEAFLSLYEKTETETANYEDGAAVQRLWEHKRDRLHVWMPHTSLSEIDYQLNEALGSLYIDDYEGTLPKLSVLIGLTESIPVSYTLSLGNIF